MSDSGDSEVVFEDNGDYIETNLITEDDLRSYRLHVATEEGSKGAPLQEALPAMELAKIIYKRRKLKEETNEAEEREKSIEKLKEKMVKKKKKKDNDKSPRSSSKRQYRKKSPEKKSRSPRKSSKKESHSSSRRKSRSPAQSRKKSRSRSKSRKRSRSRSKDSGRKSRSRKHRSRSRGSRRRRRKVWESKSRSRSRSKSKGRDDYIKKCRSVQNGPDLPESRPVERRRRHHRRSSSSSVERPTKGLPSSSSYLAIEGPECDKALVTLYPSATPSLGLPTLDRVRLPAALAQQLFPVSCGSEHKDEEGEEEKQASILAIEGATKDGETEEEEKKPPTLSEIMQMRIEANKLLVKNPNDAAAKKILHEAQILMNRWQAVSAKSTGGRYTGATLATPMPKEMLDCHHPLTWARKDMFMNLAPVTESPGMQLMMKMGWSSGKGLGKEESGDVNPLRLSVKTDRKGLSSEEEVIRRNPAADRGINVVGCNWVVKIVNGKHAVSGLGEIHQHIGKPCPEYIDSTQPGVHQITCKTAWGQFTPPAPSLNKKDAKGRSALNALKRILAIEADKYHQPCPVEEPQSGVLCVVFKTTTAAMQAAKYQANFNDPNQIINIANQIVAQANRPALPAGIPHLRPPAQESAIQRPSIRAAEIRQALQNPAINTRALQRSIETLISNQRLAANRPGVYKGGPRMQPNMQRPMINPRQPRPPHNMVNRTNLMQPPRAPNMMPPRPMNSNARVARPPQQGNGIDLQKMIAMATQLTGSNRPPRPPT